MKDAGEPFDPKAYLPAITETLTASGLHLERETTSPARRVTHLVFHR